MECEYKDQLGRCIKTEGTNSTPFCNSYPHCLYKKGRESIVSRIEFVLEGYNGSIFRRELIPEIIKSIKEL